jgi:hypothetical protein
MEDLGFCFIDEWRRWDIVDLHYFCTSTNIFRVIKSERIRWAEHVARIGEWRGVKRVLVTRPEGNRPLERYRRRWEDDI